MIAIVEAKRRRHRAANHNTDDRQPQAQRRGAAQHEEQGKSYGFTLASAGAVAGCGNLYICYRATNDAVLSEFTLTAYSTPDSKSEPKGTVVSTIGKSAVQKTSGSATL